jgi:nucleoid-associated protein YgaU
MLLQNSRYRGTPPFESDEDTPHRFPGTRPRDIRSVPGAIEHVLQQGERADLLALHYYGDSNQWWLILDANPDLSDARELEDDALAGTVIVIPPASPPGGGQW